MKTMIALATSCLMVGGCASVTSFQTNMADILTGKDTGIPSVKSTKAPTFNPDALSKLAVIVWRDSYDNRLANGVDRSIEDEFLAALLEKGYSIASRSDTEATVKELSFQRDSGLTDRDATKIGKFLNVSAILIVSITEFKNQETYRGANSSTIYTSRAALGARLISVEKQELLWVSRGAHNRDVHGGPGGSEILGKVAKAMADSFPGRTP